MKQFVKAVEIWVPGTRNKVLELGSAYYGELENFKTISESMSFAFGEGLPGKTWSTGRAIVLNDINNNSYFQRAEAAKQASIDSGISIPIFCGEFLQAVIILFCGGEDVNGAMEVWHNTNSGHNELSLVDGYYGKLEKFEWVSRRLTIMRGRGLPGSAWAQARPVVMDDLGSSSAFLRASHAAEVGITTGLAIPFNYMKSDVEILTLLSATGTPIARRFEIWTPNVDRTHLQFDSGQCEAGTDLGFRYNDTTITKGEGPMGESWLSGRPLVADIDPHEGNAMIVLPVIKDCTLNAMVCLVL